MKNAPQGRFPARHSSTVANGLRLSRRRLALTAVDGVLGAIGDRVHVTGSAADRVTRGSRHRGRDQRRRKKLLNHEFLQV